MNIPVIKSVTRDIANFYPTSVRIAKAGKLGYKIGQRYADMHNDNFVKNACTKTKGVYKKIANETTLDDLPVVAGAIGLLCPIWLANPIFYICGFIAREIIQKYQQLKYKN